MYFACCLRENMGRAASSEHLEVSLTRQARLHREAKRTWSFWLAARSFAVNNHLNLKSHPHHTTVLWPFLAPSMGKDKVSEDRVMQWIQVVSPDPP